MSATGSAAPDDPLRACPHGCLVEAYPRGRRSGRGPRRYCPWHGEELKPILGSPYGGFRIEKKISEAGGFGVVYYAWNPEGKLERAIKLLRPPGCYETEKIEAFIDEVRNNARRLQGSEVIVQVYDVRRDPWPHILMEFVNAGSLHGRMEELRRRASETGKPHWFSLAEARSIVLDVAEALRVAHERGVVHRDLKPHNVLLHQTRKDGIPRAKVVDWGISLRARRTAADGATVTEEVERTALAPARAAGLDESQLALLFSATPKYAPPEYWIAREAYTHGEFRQEHHDALIDPRYDVYQFGLIAYEVLSGEFPFPPPQGSVDRLAYWRDSHLKSKPPPLEIRAQGKLPLRAGEPRPKRLAKVVARALEKDPEKRYRDGAQLYRALARPALWESRAAQVAALLILVFSLGAYLFWPEERPGGIAGFWSRWAAQAAETRAYLDVEKLRAGGGELELGTIWIRKPEDLEGLRYRPELPPVRALENLSLTRWRRWDAGSSGIAKPEDPEPLGAAASGFAKWEGGGLELDLGALLPFLKVAEARKEARAEDPSLREYVFSLDGESVTSGGGRRLFRQFFRVRLDPKPPSPRLAAVSLIHPERGPFDYPIDSARGVEELRLFAPAGTETDVELRIELGKPPEALDEITANGRRLPDELLSGDVLRLRLKKHLYSDSYRGASDQGARYEIVLGVRAKADRAAGGEPIRLRRVLILDSGPDASADARGPVEEFRLAGGKAGLYLEWRENGARTIAGALRIRWRLERDGAPWSAWSPAAVAGSASKGGPSRTRSAIEIPLPPVFLEGAGDAVLAVEAKEALLYPKGFEEGAWKEIGRLTLSPDPPLSLGDVNLILHFEKSAPQAGCLGESRNAMRLENGTGFEWRTRNLRDYPHSVTLELKTERPCVVESVRWNDGKEGSERLLETPSGTREVETALAAALRTTWGRTLQVPLRLRFDPEIPAFPDRIEVLADGEPCGTLKPQGPPLAIQARKPRALVLRCKLSHELRSIEAEAVNETTKQRLGWKAARDGAGGDSWLLEALEPPGEGTYALRLKLEDAFCNQAEYGGLRFAILGDPPRFRLPPGITAGPEEFQSVQGDVEISIEDLSGVTEIRVERGGKPCVWRSGIVPDPESGILIEDVSGGAATRIKVKLRDVSRAGEAIAIRASDSGADPALLVLKLQRTGRPPGRVEYLGLEWLYIGDEREGFYVSKSEIPRWFHRAKARPESAEDRLPQTRVTPAEIYESLKKRGVTAYLPTLTEWNRLFSRPLPKKKTDPGWSELSRSVVCLDYFENERAPLGVWPADRPPPNPGIQEEWFSGAWHLLGNVDEIVEDEAGGYAITGGNYTTRFSECAAQRQGRFPGPRPNIGYRLVIYHSSPGDSPRRADPGFAAAVEKARGGAAASGAEPESRGTR